MVLVWTISGKAAKGEDIKGIGVCGAPCDLARDIVAGIESPASGLNGKNL
jgi:hypothetical protein